MTDPKAARGPQAGTGDALRIIENLSNLRGQFERIAALHPNDQPHYPNGVRPFGTGDLRHFIATLTEALAALSAGTVEPERLESRCQHCGGEIQGFMCQSCPATFHENADGYLVFDDAAPDSVGIREADEPKEAHLDNGEAG